MSKDFPYVVVASALTVGFLIFSAMWLQLEKWKTSPWLPAIWALVFVIFGVSAWVYIHLLEVPNPKTCNETCVEFIKALKASQEVSLKVLELVFLPTVTGLLLLALTFQAEKLHNAREKLVSAALDRLRRQEDAMQQLQDELEQLRHERTAPDYLVRLDNILASMKERRHLWREAIVDVSEARR